MKPRFRRFVPPIACLAFLLVAACGGGSEEPPLPQHATTPEIQDADQQLTLAIDKCTGRVIGFVKAPAQGQLSAPDTTSCYDDFIVALLLWKSAPKTDGTLAINDPIYRQYLILRIRNHINKLGMALPPPMQTQVAEAFIASYHNYFIPRLSGQLSPTELALLQSSSGF